MAQSQVLHDLLSHHPTYAAGGEVGDGSPGEGDEPTGPGGLHAVAQELISAVRDGDAAQVAACLQDAFELLEAAPHEEYAGHE